MTRAQILAEIDRRLGERFTELVAAQEAYRERHGRYFQGVRTHSAVPADGAEAVPDRTGGRPHYQAESWKDLGTLPATMMSSLEIHWYDGPAGQGWYGISEVKIGDRTLRRVTNHGPETWRNGPWREAQ